MDSKIKLFAKGVTYKNGSIDEILIGKNETRDYELHHKSIVHDFLKKNPYSEIRVNIAPNYPLLTPSLSANGEKIVKSCPNDTEHDNLLKLPRIE
ncbi:MAG: DUF3892 domain-containing protein [Defluviitaleaceae bacterium]|nr:DUF3892 domain-containing protein [Defluviitaleaceae bacterium]